MVVRIATIAFLAFLFMLMLHSCLTFRMNEKEIDEFFHSRKITGTQHQYSTGNYPIHYAKAGDETKPLVLFVHGSPGSLSAFIDFLTDTTLTQHALLITTDRPGFGYSNFGKGERSIEKQASVLKPILEMYKQNRPIILVGHSLGGAVVARIAMDYPEMVDGLILVGASIDPELEPNEKWFRAPLATPLLRWLLPRSFRASNEEICHFKAELESMMSKWEKITCPVIVIHGKKDSLVPVGNTDFAKRVLTKAPTEVIVHDDVNHFIPWNNPQFITQAIFQLLEERPAAKTNP
jgi:pimeloyl-ACP methyl ester carboxylesterase